MQGSYSTYDEDGFIEVYALEDCLRAIRQRNVDNERRIEYLQSENDKLKSEHYKDEELKKMKAELETARSDLYRGFGITEEEEKRIDEWKRKHDIAAHNLTTLKKKAMVEGAIGGRFSYHFLPTSIGTIGVIECSCGEKFTFCKMS